MNSKPTGGVTTSGLLEAMDEDLNKPFFADASDLKAAYAVGMLLNRAMYLQRTTLKTRGLVKKMRYLLDQPTREKILKIFSEVNSVMFAVYGTDQERSVFSRLRERTEVLLADAEWSSPPEEVILALMMGFDLFSRAWKTSETKKDDDSDE